MKVGIFALIVIFISSTISGMELPEPQAMEIIEQRGQKRPLENPSFPDLKKHETEFDYILNSLQSLPASMFLARINELLSNPASSFQFWNYGPSQTKILGFPTLEFFEHWTERWSFIRSLIENIIIDSPDTIRNFLIPLVLSKQGALGVASLIYEYANIIALNPLSNTVKNYFGRLLKLFIKHAQREQLFEALYATIATSFDEHILYRNLRTLFENGVNPLVPDAYGKDIRYYISNNLIHLNPAINKEELIRYIYRYSI